MTKLKLGPLADDKPVKLTVAFGFVDPGTGPVSLPARFLRSTGDRACWHNTATDAAICA